MARKLLKYNAVII